MNKNNKKRKLKKRLTNLLPNWVIRKHFYANDSYTQFLSELIVFNCIHIPYHTEYVYSNNKMHTVFHAGSFSIRCSKDKEIEQFQFESKCNYKRNKDREILQIMKETGWTYRQVSNAKVKAHTRYNEYLIYKFWQLDEYQQSQYLTSGFTKVIRKKYNLSNEEMGHLNKKNLFCTKYSEFIGRNWVYNRDTNWEEFCEKFSNEQKLIYKPQASSLGKGTRLYDLTERDLKSVYNEIIELWDGVVDGYIEQHPTMSQLSLNSVNTVRVVTIYDGVSSNTIYAVVRMARDNSFVDNAARGGLVAVIDMSNGKVITDGYSHDAERFAIHPNTGVEIKGFQIPFWSEILELTKKTASMVNNVGYLGWDVAITKQGPVLIETNTSPDPMLIQVPCHCEWGKGMRYLFDEYMNCSNED